MPTETQIKEIEEKKLQVIIDDKPIDLTEYLKTGGPALNRIYDLLRDLAETKKGLKQIYNIAADLDKQGLFAGMVWHDPKKLVPTLVGGTLLADHPNATLELVSNLRMLAYATGKSSSKLISREEALDFLEQMIVHNLNYAFKDPDPQKEDSKQKRAYNMIQLILSEIPFESLKDRLAEEVQAITAQRPILTKRVKDIIKLVNMKLDLKPENKGADEILFYYLKVINQPTEQCTSPSEYKSFLSKATEKELSEEAQKFGSHLNKTGLASTYHAHLVRRVYKDHPDLMVSALDMAPVCVAEYREHQEFVRDVVETAISPEIPQSVYGLSRVLEKGLFSQRAVQNALYKIMKLELHPEVEEKIQESDLAEKKNSALRLLVAGTVNVLGQPLGIGQGHNPTCQSVRGISLWSSQSPGKLLDMIITAARSNDLEYHFEGDVLKSSQLPLGLFEELYLNLDPVSIVLVPHLDRIYNEMMRRVSFRGQDGHKWVNPAFYGYWIPTAFMSAFDPYGQMITNHEHFIRTFFATQHPFYNGGFKMVFPNPLGIVITSSYGDFSGYHAVSLLRVDRSPSNEWRAYFLNPQNEGRQNWGQGIKPTVEGNGEIPGESSLPFDQFASRVYAFHYNSLESGDTSRVDLKKVKKVSRLTRESWGANYPWV